MLVMARPDKVCFTVPPRAHPSTGSQSQILSVQVRFQGERERVERDREKSVPETLKARTDRRAHTHRETADTSARHTHAKRTYTFRDTHPHAFPGAFLPSVRHRGWPGRWGWHGRTRASLYSESVLFWRFMLGCDRPVAGPARK